MPKLHRKMEREPPSVRRYPLHTAVMRGKLWVMKQVCVSDDQLVGERDAAGLYPLHYAAITANLQATKLLLSYGSAVDVKDAHHGMTPLHLAAGQGNCGIVGCLLAEGASVSMQDDRGNTPLMTAASKGHQQVVELLLSTSGTKTEGQADKQVLVRNRRQQTALHVAVVSRGGAGRAGCVRQLLRRGADIHVMDENGWTPLLLAIFHNKVSVVRVFAEWNCSFRPPPSSPTQLNPWVAALSFGRLTICQVMYVGGCDLTTLHSLVSDPRLEDRFPQLSLHPMVRNWLAGMRQTSSSKQCAQPLRGLCRGAIRQAMGMGVPLKVAESGLPKLLQNYLVLC